VESKPVPGGRGHPGFALSEKADADLAMAAGGVAAGFLFMADIDRASASTSLEAVTSRDGVVTAKYHLPSAVLAFLE
jgi:hypothetical protein